VANQEKTGQFLRKATSVRRPAISPNSSQRAGSSHNLSQKPQNRSGLFQGKKMTQKGFFDQLKSDAENVGKVLQPISLVGERQCKQNVQSGFAAPPI
jgi:hypothetical protein